MKIAKSPFKFLDSYQQEDDDVFFGREQETEDLYNALSGVKHLLVYGPSGAGKTSLIECGLRNQFSDADWFALSIRRNENMISSVFSSINKALQTKLKLDPKTNLPLDKNIDFGQAIEELFAEKYQPIYLLFDQFEELLILGNKEEKIDFFFRLNQLIRYKVPCRMMLIMREEFIGHLSEFEHYCPSIFQHRFRLEKMGRSNVRNVIFNILEAPRYQRSFDVEENEELADHILSKLPDQKREIELTHVQVFLSELWERAFNTKSNGVLPLLHQGLIKKDDNLEGVLDSFLKKQLDELDEKFGEKASLELLAGMISERHTKLQLSEKDLQDDLHTKKVKLKQTLEVLLQELEQRRIIRTIKASDQTKYEISHDLLTLVVGQNLTEEMKMRNKAEDIYKVYQEREGYFSKEELNHIFRYHEYKSVPKLLHQRMETSQAHWEEQDKQELLALKATAEKEAKLRSEAEKERQNAIQQKNQATQRTRLAIGVSILTLIFALFAGYFYFDANQKKNEARKLGKEAEKERINAENLKGIAEAKTVELDTANQKLAKQINTIKEEQKRTQTALDKANIILSYFPFKKNDGVAWAYQDGKLGLIDSDGRKISDFIYDEVSDFSDGIAVVKVDDKFTLINLKGKEVSELYHSINVYKDNIYMAELNDKITWLVHGISATTLEVESYDAIIESQNTSMYKVEKNGKWGYISKEGKETIPIKFKSSQLGDFKDGLVKAMKEDLWGFLDKNGKWQIPPTFDYTMDFILGRAIANFNGKIVTINRKGEVIDEKFSSQNYMWCLNNGHGKKTSGKRSPKFEFEGEITQLIEYEFNRDIVERIMKKLDDNGIAYFDVVPDQDTVGNILEERMKRIEDFPSTIPKILISIHCNAGPSKVGNQWTKDKGIQTWYKYNDPPSQFLAEVFHSSINSYTGLNDLGTQSREIGEFYLLKKSKFPSIQIENGFYNNKEEVKELMKEEVRDKIADAYINAILFIENGNFKELNEIKGASSFMAERDKLNQHIDDDIVSNNFSRAKDNTIFRNDINDILIKKDVLPKDEFLTKQLYLKSTKVIEAWKYMGSLGSQDVSIAIIDKGFDIFHHEFIGKLLRSDEYHLEMKDIHAHEYPNDNGTSIAGIAFSSANGKGIVGVAPNSEFLPVRSDKDIEGKYTFKEASLADIIIWGARESGDDFNFTEGQITYIRNVISKGRNGKSNILIFPSGNSKIENMALTELHSDVIFVSSIDSIDQPIFHYSDRYPKISVCAPSGKHSIITTSPSWEFNQDEWSSKINTKNGHIDGYQNYGGTSAAAAIVAGICALMLSENPDLTANEVKEILEMTADQIGDKNEYSYLGYSKKYGYGRVNALEAVKMARERKLRNKQNR